MATTTTAGTSTWSVPVCWPGMGSRVVCTHSDNFGGTWRHAALLDQAMIALLADLHANRLPSQTLVVLGTEFGWMLRINGSDKDNHHDKAHAFGWGWVQALGCVLPDSSAPSRERVQFESIGT